MALSQDNGPSGYKGSPYQDSKYQGGAQKIPGTVNCAFYDRGGEGVAYHDSDAKNNGSGALNPANGTYVNEFRMGEGVDTSYTKFHPPFDPQIDDNPYDPCSTSCRTVLRRMDCARRVVQHHRGRGPRGNLRR